MVYKEGDLVLKVSKNVNPKVWDEGFYQRFMDILFKNRKYQKEATEVALRFLNSGEYESTTQLARENFRSNEVIQARYSGNFEAMKADLGLPDKLSGTIDLATGTGKSYVMIALALIMLAGRKVDRVLVLVPSLTIETELTQKFKEILSNDQLVKSLGETFEVPEILNGDSTLVPNSIVIENRNAIYSTQSSRNSIIDSLRGQGERTLVLNDEVHHVYYSESSEWKKFINDDYDNDIKFKYVVGLSGTPYKSRTKSGGPNEYFADVIYRYSLREAIEQNFVKDIEYIAKEDMPSDKEERWQVILNSHDDIASSLKDTISIKPITIIVTNSQINADSQAKKFKTFLSKSRGLSKEEVDDVVLSVHSGSKAAPDRVKLLSVDEPNNPVEFIFSVSMLTEGWDVKRVFQIVPDDERAFNSKLLIAQVLGRGLRRPNGWQSSWGSPKVVVFNHEKWANNVQALVDEILDIRKTITVRTALDSEYNFDLDNVEYKSSPTTVETPKLGTYNTLWDKGVTLPTDSKVGHSTLDINDIYRKNERTFEAQYSKEVISVQDMAEILYSRFEDLEDKENVANYQNLWSIDRIETMIRKSMADSGNSDITKKIKNAFLSSMNILFRTSSKSVSYDTNPTVFLKLNTKKLPKETSDLSSFKHNRTLYFTDKIEDSLIDDASRATFSELSDSENGYKFKRVENKYHFKTPQFGVTVVGEPERLFMKRLISSPVAENIDSFVKSSDTNFYQIDYVWQKGTHQQTGKFNPDWFIKQGNTIFVVETKDDTQIQNPDLENYGKYKAAKEHFSILNSWLRKDGRPEEYKFNFLTPKSYDVFFEKLIAHDASTFRSDLDVQLGREE